MSLMRLRKRIKMREFRCPCKWSYVICGDEVFGPIFDDGNAKHARVMTMEEFKDGYSDCAWRI